MKTLPNPSPHWSAVDEYYSTLGLPDELLQWMCVGRDKKTLTLDKYIATVPNCTVLEVGTFIGVSTAGIALSNPSCTVCTVDPNYPITVIAKNWGVLSNEGSLHFANAAFDSLGVSDRIRVFEGYFSVPTSTYWDRYVTEWQGGLDVAWRTPPVVFGDLIAHGPFDVAFIDGDHSTAGVYADLVAVCQLLTEEGVILLDDVVGHRGPAINSAIDRFRYEQREFSSRQYSFVIENDIGVMRRER
jgi:predicted O-methyltransferase YrrM